LGVFTASAFVKTDRSFERIGLDALDQTSAGACDFECYGSKGMAGRDIAGGGGN